MVCSCGENNELVEAKYRDWYRTTFTPVIAIDHIVMDMAHRYGARIEVVADQWFGVSVKTKKQRYYVECDRISDGLIAVLMELYSA
jgi:hypothetical protein